MQGPIEVEIDKECGAAYVRYRVGETPVGPTIEVGGEGSEVLADVNAAGEIIGIEVVDITIPESLATARAFALAKGLSLPELRVP